MSYVNRKTYTFNVTETDKIFYLLLKDKQVKLSEGHRLLKPDEIKERKYCKFHNSFDYVTNECVRFRDLIQKALMDRRLKFIDKPKADMKVDTDPFQTGVSYVNQQIPLNIGMIDIKNLQEFNVDMKDTMDIYPKPGKSLNAFLERKRESGKVRLYPSCNAVYEELAVEKEVAV